MSSVCSDAWMYLGEVGQLFDRAPPRSKRRGDSLTTRGSLLRGEHDKNQQRWTARKRRPCGSANQRHCQNPRHKHSSHEASLGAPVTCPAKRVSGPAQPNNTNDTATAGRPSTQAQIQQPEPHTQEQLQPESQTLSPRS